MPTKRSYNGRLLRVNLTTGNIAVQHPPEVAYRMCLGGRGFVSCELLKRTCPGIDPLGPENVLTFATGVLTGLPFPGAGRHSVGAKSPLTGLYGEAESGGFWGTELKKAGFDAVVMEGCAQEPVYLWVSDGEAELRSAASLWGLTTGDAQRALVAELGDARIRVAAIGPAGERGVRYACIINDLHDAAGRTGLGAVMGSKRLKAIVVRGTQPIHSTHPDRIRAFAQRFAQEWRGTRLARYHDMGTSSGVAPVSDAGALPTRNYSEGVFEHSQQITGESLRDTLLVGREGCFSCPIQCKRMVAGKRNYALDDAYGGPEYETIAALGSQCGVGDLEAISYANQLCNAYGVDTISTGMTIAFAMECLRQGILTLQDTDGLRLDFGDAAAMVTAVQQICEGHGFGKRLGLGVARLAEDLGPAAEEAALVVKGMEVAEIDPRYRQPMALGYAVSPTGGDHTGAHDPLHSLYNMAVVCGWPIQYSADQLAELLSAAAGWDMTTQEALEVGERGLQLTRAYNTREGAVASQDRIPGRFSRGLPTGPLRDRAIDVNWLEKEIQSYYKARGWDQHGRPCRSTLAALGLDWVADLLGPELLGHEPDCDQ